MKTLTVKNIAQVALFEMELKGQLSDGLWENATPYNHWVAWSEASAIIGGGVGRNFYAQKDNYALDSKLLLCAIGNRMINNVKLSMVCGIERAKQLACLFDLDGNIYLKTPQHKGAYWDGVRATIATIDLVELNEKMNAINYTEKDLKKDLKELKVAFRTYNR